MIIVPVLVDHNGVVKLEAFNKFLFDFLFEVAFSALNLAVACSVVLEYFYRCKSNEEILYFC